MSSFAQCRQRIVFATILFALVVSASDWSAQRIVATASAARSVAKANSTDAFAVFSVATGKRDPRFPRLIRDANHDPEVLAAVPDGSGGWFVGGMFSKSDGVPCPNLAHFMRNGMVDSHFCPAPNGRVVALLAGRGGLLYVAGSFTRVDGAPRAYLALIDTGRGRLQPWNAHIAGRIYYDRSEQIPRGVWALALGVDTLYVAGEFDSVGGSPHRSVAAIRVLDANPTSFRAPRGDIYGSSLVVLTESSMIVNGYSSEKSGLVALDPRSGTRQLWKLQGGTATALVGDGDTLIATQTRMKSYDSQYQVISQYQAATGRKLRTITATRPSPNPEITTLDVSGSRLYVGGVFSRIDNTARKSLAAFDLPSRRLLPWRPAGAQVGFGDTLAIASTSTSVAVGVGNRRPV